MALRRATLTLPTWLHSASSALLMSQRQLACRLTETYCLHTTANASCYSRSNPEATSRAHFTTHLQPALGTPQLNMKLHQQPMLLVSSLSRTRPYCKWAQPSTPTAAESQPVAAADAQPQHSAAEAASSFITTDTATAAAATGTTTGNAAAAVAASAGGVLAGAAAAPTAEYTMRQVSKHASDETCWIVVNGKVYDVTSYIDDHPGGAESILLNAGVDCTEEFMGVHSQEAKDLSEKFVIGKVKAGSKKTKAATAAADPPAAAAAAAAKPLPRGPLITLQDPRERYALPLAEKKQLNHDTFFMRFELPTSQHQLGLPCGKHVFLCADIAGEAVIRAYTPISGDRDLGVLDFLIKVYWAGVHPKFPAGGKMTQYLAAMKEGDKIDVKGPYGKFTYDGLGQYQLNRVPGKARYMSMVAGGSGITPCYSVLREVLRNPEDTTRCALIYANKHEQDIWLREELDAMARNDPDRFHLWYVLEEPGVAPTPMTHTTATVAAAAAAAAAGREQPSLSLSSPAVAAANLHQQQQNDYPAAAAAESRLVNPQQLVNTQGVAPWTFSTGYITHDMMAQHLLPPRPIHVVRNVTGNNVSQQQQHPSDDVGGSMALMCGPPGMLEGVVVPGLAAMGYSAEQMVLF